MKRLATVASLLLAMAGTAAAQPGSVYGGDRAYDRRTDEGYRRGDQGARSYENRWVPLVRNLTPMQPRMFIPLNGQFGPMHRLRIERMRGNPYIRGVTIEFMNGETQTVPIQRQLVAGAGVIYVDLNGGERNLRRLVVDVQPDRYAQFSVIGI